MMDEISFLEFAQLDSLGGRNSEMRKSTYLAFVLNEGSKRLKTTFVKREKLRTWLLFLMVRTRLFRDIVAGKNMA
jgi:hypothetical protein